MRTAESKLTTIILIAGNFFAHPIVGTVCTTDADVNVRTFPLKYVNVTVSGCDCVAIEDSVSVRYL